MMWLQGLGLLSSFCFYSSAIIAVITPASHGSTPMEVDLSNVDSGGNKISSQQVPSSPRHFKYDSFDKVLAEFQIVQYQPRHVHLAYTNDPTEMMVTWSTIDDPNSTLVEFGVHVCEEVRVPGTATLFRQPGKLHLQQYIHRVLLAGLVPGRSYLYHVGSDLGWSPEFKFTAMKSGRDWSPRLALYGDLGNENAQSLSRLQREVQVGTYDAVLHVGDFAYDMDSEDGLVGDSFMEQIQSIAAYVPYMTCPGNHEQKYNFSHYKHRFSMPGPYKSMMYSWDMGPIHFISLSTEFYYFLKFGVRQVVNQFQWLKNDLEEATRPENRLERPWIIVYGHRPMYCSNTGTDDCGNVDALTRVGIPLLRILGLEDLLMNYGVDLAVWAHQHSYERMYPVYNYQVLNGSDPDDPYANPRGVVHVTTGSAGCKEKHAEFKKERPPWSAFRTSDYGYSRLQVLNATHLYFEQVSDDQKGLVVDSFYLRRDSHGPYSIPEELE